jgi:hypothetical protein
MFMSCGRLLQNAPLLKVTGCWPVLKKIGILDLTSLVASAHPVSFIVKNIWLGVKIQVFGHFQ